MTRVSRYKSNLQTKRVNCSIYFVIYNDPPIDGAKRPGANLSGAIRPRAIGRGVRIPKCCTLDTITITYKDVL